MDKLKSLGEEESSQERGLLHTWKGYFYSVTPEKVLISRPVLQAALGAKHGVLLVEGGQIYSFGELPWKQNSLKTSDPILEAGLSEKRVVSVAAGTFHNGALTEDGAVHMWGDNTYGQCGLSGLPVIPNPTPVAVVSSETKPPRPVRIAELACGEQHSLALSVAHEVWSWGSGCQLGLNASSFPVWKPQRVEHLAGRHVLQVACGAAHSLALVCCPPPPNQDLRRPPEDKCGQCNQSLYTMTDKEDHVIISDSHYCPLGVELDEDDNKSALEYSLVQGTPCSRSKVKSSPSEPLLNTHTSMSSPAQAPAPVLESQDQLQMAGEVLLRSDAKDFHPVSNGEVFEESTEPNAHEMEISKRAQGLIGLTGPKFSQYPDEQALKDYLKRLSDQTLSEQTAKSPSIAPCALVSDFQHSELNSEYSQENELEY